MNYRISFLSVAILAMLFSPLLADPIVFDLEFSGTPFGNTATATGQITIDSAQLQDAGQIVDVVGSTTLPEFSLTVSGASSGNGTFFEDGSGLVLLDLGNEPLDLGQDLFGQAGFNSFGIIPFVAGGPISVDNFTIATNNGSGDSLSLVSFSPVSAIPEPSGGLVASAVMALVFTRRQKRR